MKIFAYYLVLIIFLTSSSHSLLPLQRCCYDWFSGSLIQAPVFGAGSLLQYNPFYYWNFHAQFDLLPQQWCCVQSNLCQLYYAVRPINNCFGYRSPFLGKTPTVIAISFR